jgi:hypothetical protein
VYGTTPHQRSSEDILVDFLEVPVRRMEEMTRRSAAMATPSSPFLNLSDGEEKPVVIGESCHV